MELSRVVASVALCLAAVLIAGHAQAQDGPTAGEQAIAAQKRLEEREAKRRLAVLEHGKRRQEFERRCAGTIRPAELEACRVLYRQL